MQGRTAHLAGDMRRALLMVDGNATFGEIGKRAAPSLRASLDEMFKELERGGFILDKNPVQASEHIPKMSIPVKIATPPKSKTEDHAEELDFLSGFAAPQRSRPADKAPPTNEEKAKPESFDRSRQDAEVAKLFAQQGAGAGSPNPGQDSARLLEEAVRRAKAEADGVKPRQQSEAERLRAEQEAVKMRIELAAAQAKAAQEAKAQLEHGTAKAPANMKADDDAARVREEAERIIRKEKEEALAREAREREARELEAARVREEAERIIRKEKEEALAREAREREAARIREEAERQIRKQQEEARAREALEREARERKLPGCARKPSASSERNRKKRAPAKRWRSRKPGCARKSSASGGRSRKKRRAREALALKEARVREEVERIMKQEQEEARAREAAAKERAARAAARPHRKNPVHSRSFVPGRDPLYTSESHKEKKIRKKGDPAGEEGRPRAGSHPPVNQVRSRSIHSMWISTCSRPSHKRTGSLPRELPPCNNHPLRELRSLPSLTACSRKNHYSRTNLS